MSNFGKIFIVTVITLAAIAGAGFYMSLETAKVSLQERFDKENNVSITLVAAALSSVKCDATFEEDKESEADILCREDLNAILESIFKTGLNVELTANNGAAFVNKRNKSTMDTVDPSLKSLVDFKPSTLTVDITYLDSDNVRAKNGVLTISSEPVSLYDDFDTVKDAILKMYAILGGVAIVIMGLLAFILLREKKEEEIAAQ